jgi:fatty acid desaturase
MSQATNAHSAIPSPKEQEIPSAANLFKSVFLIAMLFADYYAIQLIAAPMENLWLKWSLIALVSVWNGMLMIGMGVLSHDAVHGVLFRSRFWNEVWGGLLAALVLIPLQANRQFHMEHHRYSHQPGRDPENPMHQSSFLFALVLGPFVALYAQYRVLFAMAMRGEIVAVLKDVFFIGTSLAIYFVLVPALGVSLLLTFAPTWLALPLVFSIRALADHYGIPPVVAEATAGEEADSDANVRQQLSGWVVLTPQWLQWLWSHVNYHEVHHKYPYLSHQYLPQAFDATRGRYPYLVVDGYWRSLFNVMKRKYYGRLEDVRQFLVAGPTTS